MDPRKLTLYEPHWQALRITCLKGWAIPGQCGYRCDLMRIYLANGEHDDMYSRAWRVLNLCNATIMAFNGLGLSPDDECRRMLVDLQTEAREYYQYWRIKNPKFEVLSEDEMLEAFGQYGPEIQEEIITDLRRRFFKAKNPRENRPELTWALEIFEQAKESRNAG